MYKIIKNIILVIFVKLVFISLVLAQNNKIDSVKTDIEIDSAIIFNDTIVSENDSTGTNLIKDKYSKSVPTTNNGNATWWVWDAEGKAPVNPYDLLEALDVDIDTNTDERIFDTEGIHEGGAAMMAYAKMQFTEMSNAERQAIISGLLKSCELDTLAMVMIWDHWKS